MSAPSAVRSIARCCARCTPSTATSAPAALARDTSAAAGVTVPTPLDASVSATNEGSDLSASSNDAGVQGRVRRVDVDPSHRGAGVAGGQDPRADVGVVVEPGDDHGVVG